MSEASRLEEVKAAIDVLFDVPELKRVPVQVTRVYRYQRNSDELPMHVCVRCFDSPSTGELWIELELAQPGHLNISTASPVKDCNIRALLDNLMNRKRHPDGNKQEAKSLARGKYRDSNFEID
jgi:hypothetical protein